MFAGQYYHNTAAGPSSVAPDSHGNKAGFCVHRLIFWFLLLFYSPQNLGKNLHFVLVLDMLVNFKVFHLVVC